MPPPTRHISAKSDPTPKPATAPARLKRKRQTFAEDPSRQLQLKNLYSSQQKPHVNAIPSSPDTKRATPSADLALPLPPPPPPPPPSATPPSATPPGRKALGSGEMYNFASPSPSPAVNGNGPIDLTDSSPPASPLPRRLNGAVNGARKPLAAGRSGINPHTGAKKLVVKNLKTNSQWDSKAYLEKIWGQLDEALAHIFKDDGTSSGATFSKEDLYRGVENVCRQGGASTLFARLEGRCRQHISQEVFQPLLERARTALDSVSLLRNMLSEWRRWKEQMLTIRAISFFLDRSYLLSSSKPTLSELTPLLFRDIVFSHDRVKSRIMDGACDLVASDRDSANTQEHQDLFRQAVVMLHQLSVYTSSFEPVFLGNSQQYVSQWSDTTSATQSVPAFVSLADELIASEMARCEDFALDKSTRRDLLALLEDHLIVRRQHYLTDEKALASMLNKNAVAELTGLYALLARRRLGEQLRPGFEMWVDSTGTAIVFGDEDSMVVNLLSFKVKLDSVWRTAFQRDEQLGHGLRETFETFMNRTKKGEATWGTDNTKVGEMIAKYVDSLLRGGARAIPDQLSSAARRSSSMTGYAPSAEEIARRQSSTITSANGAPLSKIDTTTSQAENNEEDEERDEDAEMNTQLDQVLDLFRFVHGKAVFEAFYKKDLARRLLMGRSASADAERSMLARLKTECGSGFTQNLEQMFKDVELAREEMSSYKQRLEDRIGYDRKTSLDISVNILSAAAWPTYPDIPVIIPANIKRAINDFELHYKSKHSGRKLDWKHALAHCQMRASFAKGSKELVVSSFQAIVLLLFNGLGADEHLTYDHIISESGLSEVEVKRTLQSLACAKLRPLTKHPKGKEINNTDTFTVNTAFDHPKYRVKINQVQLKETKEENRATHERVAEDRGFECQAAIVRVMKSRKRISHSELVSEVIKATMSRGVLAVGDIKKNIDRLIEKDYMEREEDNMYSYVA